MSQEHPWDTLYMCILCINGQILDLSFLLTMTICVTHFNGLCY